MNKYLLGIILLILLMWGYKSNAEVVDLSQMTMEWAASNGIVGVCLVDKVGDKSGFCNYFPVEDLMYCQDISDTTKPCANVKKYIKNKELDI